MTQFKEPYYLVDFNSSICNFDIFINDMPAFNHHVGGAVSSHMPINHFILEKGIQKIKINVLPLKGEESLKPDGFITIKYQENIFIDNVKSLNQPVVLL